VYDLPQPAQSDEQSINVLISRHFTLLPRLSAEDALPVAHPQAAEGLVVDDEVWAQLKKLGERVLVESTEESRRRGAGESSDAQ
jgi:hypothetical protein